GRFQFAGQGGKPAAVRVSASGQSVQHINSASGKTISLEIDAQPIEGRPRLTVRYTIADGAPYLLVETIYANSTDKPVGDELSDAIRADRTFTFGVDDPNDCFWAADEWFKQAYGIVVTGYRLESTGQRGTLIKLLKDGSNKLELQPGQSLTIARRVFAAPNLLALAGRVQQMSGLKVRKVSLAVRDTNPVAHARITILENAKPFPAAARTGEDGRIEFQSPANSSFDYEVMSLDGRQAKGEIPVGRDVDIPVTLGKPSRVVAKITNDRGQATPAKVSFTGTGGSKDPDWGPDSGDTAVKNVYYTHTGSFEQAIALGKYDVIVSYGPEHDAVFQSIEVPPGQDSQLTAVLKRTVDTTGWISADFHSHSSPSGDNTSSQLGRVQNLLCEHVEFAPCTEHNRIDTYLPHLKKLGVMHLMATCTGMELTGGPLPVNHQNAFPLLFRPRTQDGGAPVTDVDPVIQVERLAFWDNKSDKLVQMNHPNLPQILGDRNEDGQPDAGFERMFGFVDVIEVHPPQGIFTPPVKGEGGKLERNPIFHWMQMLNLGYRNAAVINTDSHYNHHESGYFRNFIKCTTDDPAKIDMMEIVHMSEQGHLAVSTGPFLSVEAAAATADGKILKAIPGDNLVATEGQVQLAIKVQCPNWLDVNRVQVFLNGRPAQELNFTRKGTPDRFTDETVRFSASLPIKVAADTHIIVATIGEGLTLGPVMGPNYGGKLPPVAVTNPIFVDVDGKGFTPNRDLLDVPLAIAPGKQ
ncbi:MAG: CehA/McbA family metallohydrolase, partial [Planctomycetaceae bacterium]|nr:CehA/McbA family metallohydrolase [Planctomycetaceae bacterium]